MNLTQDPHSTPIATATSRGPSMPLIPGGSRASPRYPLEARRTTSHSTRHVRLRKVLTCMYIRNTQSSRRLLTPNSHALTLDVGNSSAFSTPVVYRRHSQHHPERDGVYSIPRRCPLGQTRSDYSRKPPPLRTTSIPGNTRSPDEQQRDRTLMTPRTAVVKVTSR